jgi:predicted acylesterase/phospholipase RssA
MALEKRADVAFVLSGEASLGAIQVGMLRALHARGITPDVIVGTSARTLHGAFIASRPQTVATADALAGNWRDLGRGQVSRSIQSPAYLASSTPATTSSPSPACTG